MSTRFLAAVAACGMILASRHANAQISMITTSKAAAQRAAAASNAQTAAEQNTGDPTPASVVISSPAPKAAPKYVPVPATTPAAAPVPAPAPAAVVHNTVLAQATPASQPPKPAPAKLAPAAPAPVTTKPVTTATVSPVPPANTAVPPKVPAATVVAPSVSAPVAANAGSYAADSGARTISVTQRGVKGEVSLNREVYSYSAGGRRDPFVSLMQNGDLRPLITDLRLVAVLYDPTGRNSVAVMHDVGSQVTTQYRVRVGQTLGRMRVAQIEPKQVVFTIEQVGFSRQETLALGDSTTARTQ